MSKLTGRAFIDAPGFGRLNSMPGASLDIGGFNKEAVVSDSAVEGHTESIAVPKISFSLAHRKGMSLKALADISGNITFQTDSGSTWVMSGAFMPDPPALNGGQVSIMLHGTNVDEVSA